MFINFESSFSRSVLIFWTSVHRVASKVNLKVTWHPTANLFYITSECCQSSFILNWPSFYSDEPLQITYSYWDGAGHRRVLQASLCFLVFCITLICFSILSEQFCSLDSSLCVLSICSWVHFFRFEKGTPLGSFFELFSSSLHQSFERFEPLQWRICYMWKKILLYLMWDYLEIRFYYLLQFLSHLDTWLKLYHCFPWLWKFSSTVSMS